MADINDLVQAFQKAHAAGDTQNAQLLATAIQNLSGNNPAAQAHPGAAANTPAHTDYDPTGSGYDRFMAGMGKSFVDTGRGVKQLYDMAANPQAYAQDQQQEAENRHVDAPLMHTGAGIAGDITGQVAQTMLPGGIAKYGISKIANPAALEGAQALYRAATAPPVAGAALGAINPTTQDESHGTNALLGAAGGELGARAGAGLNYIARTGEDALTRGARIASDIADKYGVKMTLPQLTSSKFVKYINSVTGEMPFSGSDARYEAQRGQFNDALGDVTGIQTNGEGVNMENWAQGRKGVGSLIGNMAQNTNGFLTPDIFNNIQRVITDADQHATPEVAGQVRSYVNSMFHNLQPVNSPLPGGPIATIPGKAWREQNTSLGNHIQSLGENEGDLERRLTDLHGSYLDMIEKGMAPDDFETFQGLRGQYANLMALKPLAQKAGTAGIDPKLLMSRANTADQAYWNNGTMKPLGELGTLGKERMTAQVPNSGTPIRHLIMATGLGGVAGAAAHHEGQDTEHSTGIGAAVPLATMVLGGLGNRALNSQLLAKYATARLPDALGNAVQAGTGMLPTAGAEALSDQNSVPDGHADGGEVDQPDDPPIHKSSFWDLVKTGIQELTGDTPPTGTGMANQAANQISGREQQIDKAVQEAAQ